MITQPAPHRKKIKITRPDKTCKTCGRRMSPGRHGRRVYCSAACKQKAYRKRSVTIATGERNE